MIKKMMTLSLLLTAGITSFAFATEYKSPEVNFKERPSSSKMMKTSEFGENYKVEDAVATDRQIASEKELHQKEEKKDNAAEEPTTAPQPWLYHTMGERHY